MNKKDLVKSMAQDAGISRAAAEKALDSLLDSIIIAVSGGEKVQLIGFGTFENHERPARTGRNFQTGEMVEIPAANVPRFKPGKVFKDAVNGI